MSDLERNVEALATTPPSQEKHHTPPTRETPHRHIQQAQTVHLQDNKNVSNPPLLGEWREHLGKSHVTKILLLLFKKNTKLHTDSIVYFYSPTWHNHLPQLPKNVTINLDLIICRQQMIGTMIMDNHALWLWADYFFQHCQFMQQSNKSVAK